MKCRSEWHSPAKAVRNSTSRLFGFSSATSSMVSGWFGACRTAAFILTSLVRETDANLPRRAGHAAFEVAGYGPAPGFLPRDLVKTRLSPPNQQGQPVLHSAGRRGFDILLGDRVNPGRWR